MIFPLIFTENIDRNIYLLSKYLNIIGSMFIKNIIKLFINIIPKISNYVKR